MWFRGRPVRTIAAFGAATVLVVIAPACGSSGETTSSTSAGRAESATTVGGDAGSTSASPTAATSTRPGGSSVPGGTPTTAAGSSTTAPAGAGTSDGTPEAPTGAFLSSHRLSVQGGSVPSAARSVCRTSPGATCVITFTMGGATHSLPTRKVDASGTTSWDWSVSDVGLTVGHWNVEIIAENDHGRTMVGEALGLDVVA